MNVEQMFQALNDYIGNAKNPEQMIDDPEMDMIIGNSNFALVYNQSKMLSLAEAIEQYVVAQAKRLIESHPTTSLKEIAYMLGFQEPSAFHRYFKRVTGINTLEYRSSI